MGFTVITSLWVPVLLRIWLATCASGHQQVPAASTNNVSGTGANNKQRQASSSSSASGGSPRPPTSSSQYNIALKKLDMVLKNYDRRATPKHDQGTPTEVQCELYVRSFGSISASTMDYEVDAYLRQQWTDDRLGQLDLEEPLDLNDPQLVQAIWKPEVYFPNAKHGDFQYVTVPNVLVRIEANGKILYMLRLKLTFSCMMELSKYPLDVQICTMEIASFSKTMKELVLKWKPQDPVKLYDGLKMPQFSIASVTADNCTDSSQIGNYSCLKAEYYMSRAIGFHLVQTYLPTTLIVVVSWVSFWIDVESVAGRTTLGVTTLLTMSSKASGVQAEIPQVSYVKALDIWMGICTAFIFAALIEFTMVNHYWRTRENPTPRQHPPLSVANNRRFPLGFRRNIHEDINEEEEHFEMSSLTTPEPSPANGRVLVKEKRGGGGVTVEYRHVGPGLRSSSCTDGPKHISHQIDESCRIIFPVLFAIFNFFYWSYYLIY